jgi:hypothetical protein
MKQVLLRGGKAVIEIAQDNHALVKPPNQPLKRLVSSPKTGT